MMYQSVLPSKHHHKKNYLVKYLEEDIAKIKDAEEKNEAERKWAELKKKLKWEDTLHKRTMKELKSRRSTTAHPTLSQKVLSESLAVMKKHDELNGWTEEQIVEDLIEMWKIRGENLKSSNVNRTKLWYCFRPTYRLYFVIIQ